jgi:GrpB-like predicted nucleotidyltransferase (UPF0157 family)
MNKYVFKKYNSKYSNYFRYEKKKILAILGSRAKVEHVGSTAIRGLGGKGIVDILVGVQQGNVHKAKNKLVNALYEYRSVASVPGRIFFRKDYIYGRKVRRVHIHLVKINGKEWNQVVSFRDYLLKHPEQIKKYAAIKKQAVKTAKGDGKIYRELKNSFIQSIINMN